MHKPKEEKDMIRTQYKCLYLECTIQGAIS